MNIAKQIKRWIESASSYIPNEKFVPERDKEGRRLIKESKEKLNETKKHFEKFSNKERN